MTKWTALFVCLSIAALGWAGCKEEMVGAPCVPETDRGEFNVSLQGSTYSIETRSVQCETRICLTKTEMGTGSKTLCEACLGSAETPEETGECLNVCEDVQGKYSFCSCRCRDSAGNTFQTNPDKYDYLCECPPNTQCEKVIDDIEGAPEKITGSYCIPNCIAFGCPDPEQTCVPSKDSEQPWQWKCEK